MIKYKFDVYKKLNEIGINTTVARETGVFGQSTMKKLKEGDTAVSMEVINRLCCVLEIQPRDLIRYVETEEDTENIYKKIYKKA